MVPAVKKDKTFTVKSKSGGEIELWGNDKGLHLKWLTCGAIARWRPDQARDQYQRLLMVTEHWQGVAIKDSSENYGYQAAREGVTFLCGEYSPQVEFSWAQFKKALDAAMKQIPANPQPEEGSAVRT